MDKNKVYVFDFSLAKLETLVFEQRKGYRFWHFATSPHPDEGFKEVQNKRGYSLDVLGGREYAVNTVTTNPIKGKKYTNKYGSSYTVVSANAVVKTKYKTFKNCMVVRVKNPKDFYYDYTYYYYAPHHGQIKVAEKKNNKLTTVIELVEVRNKKK
ncbi:hypothetical protein ACFVP8_20320 [Viridibacillus arvi]|uniref:hypothetical protein n=1 Tax=Viridibacillus arvi TaxID=263475 RepID=UPI0036BB03B5